MSEQLPKTIEDRECQKFLKTRDGHVAVRVDQARVDEHNDNLESLLLDMITELKIANHHLRHISDLNEVSLDDDDDIRKD